MVGFGKAILMTEDEAKKKWCPMIKIAPETEGFYPLTNRAKAIHKGDELIGTVTCIASECMAWRNTGLVYDCDEPTKIIERRGHCGLAGKP